MCGFIGFISDINNKQISLYEEKFQHYLYELNNRGPDYTETKNFFKNKIIRIGFSRLAIQDLNPKSNKIFYNDKAILLFNGEIYNQKILKQKYLSDTLLNTSSDTEVLFNLLLNWTKIINELNGIFSIVYIDLENNNIECIRDFTGTKPLYYSFHDNNFSFLLKLGFFIHYHKKNLI